MKLQNLIFFSQVMTLSTCLLLEINRGVKAAPFEPTPSNSLSSQQEDSFNGKLKSGVDIIDLIQRINLPPGRKPEQFESDSKQNIQSASEKYKKQQRQQVKEPTPTGITAPLITH